MLKRCNLYHFLGGLSSSLGPKGSGLLALITLVSWGAIAQPAWCYTDQNQLYITPLPNESYEILVRRARALSEVVAQQRFDQDLLIDRVEVFVSGQHNGAIAPLMRLQVNRRDWEKRPDPLTWMVDYPESRGLLQLLDTPTP